jgi:tetratricopeptide (TPR) repeat protein
MDFNDPALEHLVNKITIALQENNREEAARYMDIIIEEYPEVANILMNSIEFQTLMAENEEIAENESHALSDEDIIKPGNIMEIDEQRVIDDMNAMLDIEPTTAQEFIQKGTVLTITEQFEDALECFNNALELDPNNLSALISKGNTYELMENYEEASKVYDIVMEVEATDIYDLMSKGYVLENHQRFEDALVKKKFTVDDLDPAGNLIIQIDPEDTLDLLPGRYFYAIKLLRDHLDEDGTEVYNVETVVDKTKFIICD